MNTLCLYKQNVTNFKFIDCLLNICSSKVSNRNDQSAIFNYNDIVKDPYNSDKSSYL